MPSDAEVLCAFMEPNPKVESFRLTYIGDADGATDRWTSPKGWWESETESGPIVPTSLTLDRLHEVEARLTDEQWMAYETQLLGEFAADCWSHRFFIHLPAEQKIKALAEVLRAAKGGSDGE